MMSWKFELLTKPGTELLITEGPVWDGEQILFTQIRQNRIMPSRIRFSISTSIARASARPSSQSR